LSRKKYSLTVFDTAFLAEIFFSHEEYEA
jgi:hypothetical protein